jgi:tetratricopeptide (TPR) repeat protein
MPRIRSFPLDSVRTDGWFDRVGQTVSSFQALCEILGDRFFAFSMITGARITALTVDRRHPENTLVDFVVGGSDAPASETERLSLAEFQRRLIGALVADAEFGPAPDKPEDSEAIQHFIGPQYLLLSPLYGLELKELRIEDEQADVLFVSDGAEHIIPLDVFRSDLRELVRGELARTARGESRSAIDLGNVARAEKLFNDGDYRGVRDLLGTWPAALTIFLRTPEAQALQAETKATLAHALGLLGSACSALGDSLQAEEVLRLAVQYAGETPTAAKIYERLGLALLAERRTGESIAPLRRAGVLGSESVWPKLSEAFLARGRLLAALGATEEARQFGLDERSFEQSRREVEQRLGPAWAAWRKLTARTEP